MSSEKTRGTTAMTADNSERQLGARRRHPPKLPCFLATSNDFSANNRWRASPVAPVTTFPTGSRRAPAEVAVARHRQRQSRPALRASACKVDAIEIDPVILMVWSAEPSGEALRRSPRRREGQPHPTWARRWRRA
jgi:hypothetical protein